MAKRNTSSKTPSTITDKLVSICNDHKIYELSYVLRQPRSDCEAGNCFTNVQQYVTQYGGELLMGWSVSVRANLYIECEAHAVWKNPQRQIIDITPTDDEFPRTLFSYQKSMHANKTPSLYIPFTNSRLVKEYIELRNEFERLRCSAKGETLEIPAPLMDRIIAIDDIFLQKVGRNDACPCESGLKYKRCCGGWY